jgi:osmotically-inducible protein OsmY
MRVISILAIMGLIVNGCAPVVVGTTAAAGVAIAQERSVGNAVDDITIGTKIRNAYFQHSVDKLFGPVEVKVSEGRVLLTGKVESQELRSKATELAWQVNGVKEVINEVKVEAPTGKLAVADYSKDSWITARIKSKMLICKSIKSVNYSIETMNGVVYIMGIAQNQAELDRVINIAGTVKGVNKVVTHVRVKGAHEPHNSNEE